MSYDAYTYLPKVYTRMKIENENVEIRDLLPTPVKKDLPFPSADSQCDLIKSGVESMPKLADFGFTPEEVTHAQSPKKAGYDFRGGEENGLRRLEDFLFVTKSLGTYGKTRNQLDGLNFASKLSPWLSNGSLSVRKVYFDAYSFEEQYGHADSVKSFVNELFWRDFSTFWCLKNGNSVFFEYGVPNRDHYKWQTDLNTVRKWREGQTGMPLIDALMREMNETGYMSNRGRQIVASYLTLDLKQDWRFGAHYFEERLVDHDVT
mmetsp:Transcript_8912/g.15109  ORF Transcript_8912/g.15109 Transcript_8912/m.15109 type:complete len:262 (+) Transcript_8912:510-1295(+)